MQRPNPAIMYRLLRRSGASRRSVARIMLDAALSRESRGVHRLLALHAEMRPQAAAVVQGERRVGFGELGERMRRLAGALGARGLGPGDRMLTTLVNSPELVLATGAIRTIGAVRVPASPQWKSEELRHCLASSGARGVIFGAEASESIGAAIRGLPGLRHELVIEVDSLGTSARGVLQEGRSGAASNGGGAVRGASGFASLDALLAGPLFDLPMDSLDRAPDSPVIAYTSGTTGVPKGARPAIRDSLRVVELMTSLFRLGPRETVLIPAPLHHAAPAVLADLALLLGATVVLPARFDPEETLALLERERVTFAYLVPYMLERILRLPEETRRRYGRPALRGIVSAAAPLRPEARIAACDLFGDVLMEFYGSTETGIATFLPPEEQRKRPATVGRVVDGVDIRIIDESGRDLAPGAVGEVAIRNAWIRTDYVGLAAETASAHDRGYFRTGDLGTLDAEGYLSLCGRAKDMVNSGGVKVFPAEVERAIALHPGVTDVAVFPVADERWGEAVCAAVVPVAPARIDEEALKTWLKARIAGYKVPKRIVFEAELPRNPQGKVLKRVLREKYERTR